MVAQNKEFDKIILAAECGNKNDRFYAREE
jgi:hypothetical protein